MQRRILPQNADRTSRRRSVPTVLSSPSSSNVCDERQIVELKADVVWLQKSPQNFSQPPSPQHQHASLAAEKPTSKRKPSESEVHLKQKRSLRLEMGAAALNLLPAIAFAKRPWPLRRPPRVPGRGPHRRFRVPLRPTLDPAARLPAPNSDLAPRAERNHLRAAIAKLRAGWISRGLRPGPNVGFLSGRRP